MKRGGGRREEEGEKKGEMRGKANHCLPPIPLSLISLPPFLFFLSLPAKQRIVKFEQSERMPPFLLLSKQWAASTSSGTCSKLQIT